MTPARAGGATTAWNDQGFGVPSGVTMKNGRRILDSSIRRPLSIP